MTIPIAIGATGIAGWNILKTSEARHMDSLARDAMLQRSTAYFRDNIGTAQDAGALVKDYRLLSVALGAFGLEEDIASKAFIQKVLESDIDDDASLVNRLSDKRYLRLATAFGYGSGQADGQVLGDRVSAAYLEREFERRVGESDENLRLALNARRELQQFSGRDSPDRTLWFEVLGNPPLRKVFEGAFGFGSAYGKLPIDRQLEEFTRASERFLGSAAFADLTTADGIDRLVRNFLARSQLEASPVQSRYSAALTLLSG
ncbi:DUF1217 domain-containing protein [Paracoccus marinaquae]|uniref:DUF1217 domain-containing protein n=1 Tax=Paracoccus marinaquae TaxID=2841926 RepID=A0ABS6AF30_9RHOB|nr:DUF1217 domain-containing protein [Paracoccus marinaquae]MBU3029204.1 DUF1217 domain-containing protein [Paracoccus marinaquae]